MSVAEPTMLESQVAALRRIGSTFADAVPYPMFLCDPSGTVFLANAAFEDWLGKSREDFSEGNLLQSDVFDQQTVRSWLSRARDGSSPWSEAVSVCTAEGRRESRATLQPLRWGEAGCFALAVRVECKAGGSRPFAYRLSDGCAAVGRCASAIAHDLRTPLTGISTGIQYLDRALKDDDRHRETIDMVLSEVSNLNEMIQRLADLRTRCEAKPSRFNLRESLGEALAVHRGILEARQLVVSFHAEPFSASIRGDRDQLTRAFSALFERVLGAATEESTVRIQAARRSIEVSLGGRPPHGEYAVVDIRCSTPLQDSHKFAEAFDPSSPTWDAQMGLYVASQIFETHGGVVEVSGTPGHRLHFSVALPQYEE